MFLYIKEGRSFGPVTGADLLELLETGVLQGEDLVRAEGEKRWRKVSEVARGVMSGRIPSEPPPAKAGGSVPAGAHTVFTSAPPIPQAPAVPVTGFPEVGDGSGCLQCGTPAAPDAAFCKRCGKALPRKHCTACGRRNDGDAAFCAACGRSMERD